jgi:hypothetical protein
MTLTRPDRWRTNGSCPASLLIEEAFLHPAATWGRSLEPYGSPVDGFCNYSQSASTIANLSRSPSICWRKTKPSGRYLHCSRGADKPRSHRQHEDRTSCHPTIGYLRQERSSTPAWDLGTESTVPMRSGFRATAPSRKPKPKLE